MATQAMVLEGMRQRTESESYAEHNMQRYAEQMRARRGPTPEMYCPKHIDNSRLKTEADPRRTREIRIFVAAMVALFLLVMVYVAQHFSAIEYGYRIEAQKQVLSQLREDNRQLRLTDAELSAPLRLNDIAGKMGMAAPSPSQLVRPEESGSDSAPVLARATAPVVNAAQAQ
jgi:cell division protein FtsL